MGTAQLVVHVIEYFLARDYAIQKSSSSARASRAQVAAEGRERPSIWLASAAWIADFSQETFTSRSCCLHKIQFL